MSSPVSAPLFRDFWKTATALFREDPSTPLASRLASTAIQLSGASRCALFLKEKETWVRAAIVPGEEGPLEVPDPAAKRAAWARGALWIPLESEGEVHGFLGLEGITPDESELPESFGFFFGAAGSGGAAPHRRARAECRERNGAVHGLVRALHRLRASDSTRPACASDGTRAPPPRG